jgi:hypothetical protein
LLLGAEAPLSTLSVTANATETAAASAPKADAIKPTVNERNSKPIAELPEKRAPVSHRPSSTSALANRWQRQVEESEASSAAKVIAEKECRGKRVLETTEKDEKCAPELQILLQPASKLASGAAHTTVNVTEQSQVYAVAKGLPAGITASVLTSPLGASKLTSFLKAVPSPAAKIDFRPAPQKKSPKSSKRATITVRSEPLPGQRSAETPQSLHLLAKNWAPTSPPGVSKLSAFLQDMSGSLISVPASTLPASKQKISDTQLEEATTVLVAVCSRTESNITFRPLRPRTTTRIIKRPTITMRMEPKPADEVSADEALVSSREGAEPAEGECATATTIAKRTSVETAAQEEAHWRDLFDSATDALFITLSDPAGTPALGKSDFVALATEALLKGFTNMELPDERDLARAFVLADEDKSGTVDKGEFVKLMQLVKLGKVTGLGDSNLLNVANWGKEDTFKAAVAREATSAVASPEEIASWRQQFEAFAAVVGTSGLGKTEFVALSKDVLKRHGIKDVPSESDLGVAFALADADKSGTVAKEEFVKLMTLAKKGEVIGLGSLAAMVWNPLTWGKEDAFKMSLEAP